MPFSTAVKEQALVASGRRCCVCHEYKGVGVEVHHIKPQASGGGDTLDNAIVLCFDCHCAAGHYNANHPRGTKFSPMELRKHRDNWLSMVKNAGTATVSSTNLPNYHVSHLICMDYEAASELIAQATENLPFTVTYFEKTKIEIFMRKVLQDTLPHIWHTSDNKWGGFWNDQPAYLTLKEFHEANPDFCGNESRPIHNNDFSKEKISSLVIKQCFEEGLQGENLGKAIIEEGGCGDGGVRYYYSMRRPVFIFAKIDNLSDKSIHLNSFMSKTRDVSGMAPTVFPTEDLQLNSRKPPPLILKPGESVVVPEMVLLTNPHSDDYLYSWVQHKQLTTERTQDYGFVSVEKIIDEEYILIGPAEHIEGFKAVVDGQEMYFPAAKFNPSHCYKLSRHWCVGSCPHIFLKSVDGLWHYAGEILKYAYEHTDVSTLNIPAGIVAIRIAEIEIETTEIESITVNDIQQLSGILTLERDEYFDMNVKMGDEVIIVGSYSAIIREPQCPDHLRQKKSFINATEILFNFS